jgi:hypothetical protein
MAVNSSYAVGDGLFELASGKPAVERPGKYSMDNRPPNTFPNNGALRPKPADVMAVPASASVPPAASSAASVPSSVPAPSSASPVREEWGRPGSGIFVNKGEPIGVDGSRVLQMKAPPAYSAEQIAAMTPEQQQAHKKAMDDYQLAARDFSMVTQAEANRSNNLRRNLVEGPSIFSRVEPMDPNGGVMGRTDRPAALAANRESIQQSNFLRMNPESRARITREETAGQAADVAAAGRAPAAVAGSAPAAGRGAADDAYAKEAAKQLEALAKQAEQGGNAEAAKWYREQVGEFIKRGVATDEREKGTNKPIAREANGEEIKAFSDMLKNVTSSPVPESQMRASAGEALRGFMKMTPAYQDRVIQDPALKRAAEMAFNVYQMEMDDAQKRAFEQGPYWPVIMRIHKV